MRLVWATIRLGSASAEHCSGRLFLGLYVDTNSRRNIGRFVWRTTGDWYCTCAQCNCNDWHSICGPSIVCGCIYVALCNGSIRSMVRLWLMPVMRFNEFVSYCRVAFFPRYNISFRNGHRRAKGVNLCRRWLAARWVQYWHGQSLVGWWKHMAGHRHFTYPQLWHWCCVYFGLSLSSIDLPNIHAFHAMNEPILNVRWAIRYRGIMFVLI